MRSAISIISSSFITARGHRGRADADAATLADRLSVEGNAVLVDGDAGVIQHFGGDLPVQAFRTEIHEHEVVIRAAADDAVAVLGEAAGERLGVADDLLRVGLEGRIERFAEAHRLGSDDVLQRPALNAREDLGIDAFCELLLADDDAAARPRRLL